MPHLHGRPAKLKRKGVVSVYTALKRLMLRLWGGTGGLNPGCVRRMKLLGFSDDGYNHRFLNLHVN